MTASPRTLEQLARDAGGHDDPEEALRALSTLRAELADLESKRVAEALRAGASWSRIAAALGVSKQAAHRKHREALARWPEPSDQSGKILVTAEARRCVQLARERAAELGSRRIGTEHLLLGILSCRRSHAVAALASLGVTLERATELVQPTAADAEVDARSQRDDITPHARRILEGALREATATRDGYIGVEHLLLSLLTDRDNGAVLTLQALGTTPDEVRAAIDRSWSQVAAKVEQLDVEPAFP